MQLLSTKMFIPPGRRQLVPRPRLVERLNAGLEYKLILVSAPAGYGKTTLLSHWLNQIPYASAWISLDESDNDLAHFLHYLVGALQNIHPEIGKSILAMLKSPQVIQSNNLLSSLINEITQLKDPFVLAFDDYYVIQDPSVHQAVNYLLEYLPRQMHLAISTRADPPFPLAKLRVRDQLLELRQTDLRFTEGEADWFLCKLMGLTITKEEVGTLAARTEGWIAGLQMAAVSIQGCEDVSLFIQSFAGSNRHILDYLLEEVMDRQPEQIQIFLQQTSILNRLTAPLCDAVCGRNNSQSTLEFLERANLFVVSLDDCRCWFRYHHLFSDLLRQRLILNHPTQVSTLHLRASEWYEAQGLMAEAISHAFFAEEFQRAARLLERTADSTLLFGEINTFLSWVERLPVSVEGQYPLLCIYHAVALLLSGRSMEQIVKRLEGAPEYDAIQALVASYRGDVELSKQLSMRALQHLPDQSVFLKGMITSALGAVLMLGGYVEPAIQAFGSAAAIGRDSGNLILHVIALSRLGQMHILKGDLHAADGYLRKAIELSEDRQGGYLPVASMSLMVLAYLMHQWNELDKAFSFIQNAVDLCQVSGGFWSVDCFVVKAFVLQSQGDTAGALEAIQKAHSTALLTPANRFDEIYTRMYETRLLIAQGDLAGAVQLAGRVEVDGRFEPDGVGSGNRIDPELFHLFEIEQTTRARLFLALGKPSEALQILSLLFLESTARDRKMSVIENQVLQALAHQSQGNLARALTTLEPALTAAEPGGFVRVFVDEGQPMQQLLKTAVQQAASDYSAKLLDAFGKGLPKQQAIQVHHEMVEKLSAREVEVLELVARGCSDKTIAQTLFLSRETVHSHLTNIYGKLGAHSRTGAVARARELGLL